MNTRVKNISEPNRVKSVRKLSDGSLAVTQYSGRTFQIRKEDELFQAFVVYSMIAGL